MVEAGTKDIDDDWSVILDTTDNFESKVASISIADTERTYNSLYEYIKATFKINSVISVLQIDNGDSKSIEIALSALKDIGKYEIDFKALWGHTIRNQSDDEDRTLLSEMVKYETTYFDRYVELLLKVRGKYQHKSYIELLDSLSQKNNERGFLAQGRSKKHPRRYVLGTRLLEALVQIQVLHLEGDKFITQSLSIEELMNNLRKRYGLIINGLEEERFKNVDIHTHLAFKENVEAFKIKLRQIGFYNDLSDAYILQKIRPRYELT
ncbi:hypothetical protein [Chryseobacterium sp. SC28]|uniref:hypothetical protein n=1 Tax=Chryseobacterium sp. SC28 TaxID=2268028 RepID=UPI000F646344|nr:hypothetical protein [Chryseobacterium sp. SC28]RRQ44982.1 hypothetical protein DTW91_12670 [Chryseobacterium sp. SC28]